TERWPQVLPGRRGVLFTANPGNTQFDRADTEIRVYVFATGESKTLLREAYFPRFLSADNGSGYLLYVHEGTLFAVPFDLSRLELRGKPVPILEDLAADVVNGGGQFTFSATGTLIYLSGRHVREETSVAWMDAAGNRQPLSLPTGGYTTP